MAESEKVDKENINQNSNKSKSRNPNFVTGKCKTGGGRSTPGITFDQKFTYIESDYDRQKDLAREKLRKHKQLIPRPFSSTVRQRDGFTKDSIQAKSMNYLDGKPTVSYFYPIFDINKVNVG